MRRILALVLAVLPGIHGQVQVNTYIDASAMQCPEPKPELSPFGKCLPLYTSCRGHGLDETVCAVNEAAVWACCVMLVGGSAYLFVVYSRIAASKKKLGDQEDNIFSEHQVLMRSISPPGSPRGEPGATGTGRFIGSRLGTLYHKHNEICSALESSEIERDFWKCFGQLLGLWNLVVPAVSIVMQGLLKVSDNKHHAGTGQYEDTPTVNYHDYDLQECARSFRQGSVAVFTIAAIVLQSVSKIFQPDTRTGVLEERVARIQRDKEKFERDVSRVGHETAHTADDNAGGSGQ
mmetsp:Transcript_103691/g.184224  ORF Transcript_103691/g.184224 Transcript_103691/m.184224 type:complete len:291 (-) Transcript_103691:208-1080(-)